MRFFDLILSVMTPILYFFFFKSMWGQRFTAVVKLVIKMFSITCTSYAQKYADSTFSDFKVHQLLTQMLKCVCTYLAWSWQKSINNGVVRSGDEPKTNDKHRLEGYQPPQHWVVEQWNFFGLMEHHPVPSGWAGVVEWSEMNIRTWSH